MLNTALLLTTDTDDADEAARHAKAVVAGLNDTGEDVSVLGPVNASPNGIVGGINPPPTMDDLIAAVTTLFPGATVGEDNDGQIIVYTNAQQDDEGSTVHYGIDSDDDGEGES